MLNEKEVYQFECLKSLSNVPELQLQEYCNILKKLKEEFVVHRFRDFYSYDRTFNLFSKPMQINIRDDTNYLGMFTSPAAPVRALPYEPVADSRSRINSRHLWSFQPYPTGSCGFSPHVFLSSVRLVKHISNTVRKMQNFIAQKPHNHFSPK